MNLCINIEAVKKNFENEQIFDIIFELKPKTFFNFNLF